MRAGWWRKRALCFQLIHFLPDVGSHLYWLETEHKPGILMTISPHPCSSLSTSLHMIRTPPSHMFPIYSTFCLLNWFLPPPPPYPHFTLLISSQLSPHAAALRRPRFWILASSLSIQLGIWPPSSSPAAPSITYRLHYPVPFLLSLAYLDPQIPPISPSASLGISPVSSALALCFLSFSICLLSCVLGLPPATILFLSLLLCLCLVCQLTLGPCGSQGWWDVKSEVCVFGFDIQKGRINGGIWRQGFHDGDPKHTTGQLRRDVRPGPENISVKFL